MTSRSLAVEPCSAKPHFSTSAATIVPRRRIEPLAEHVFDPNSGTAWSCAYGLHSMPADTKVDLPYAAQHTAPLLMLWTCAVFYCEIEVVYCNRALPLSHGTWTKIIFGQIGDGDPRWPVRARRVHRPPQYALTLTRRTQGMDTNVREAAQALARTSSW